jgi:hypothetical protein
VKNDAAILSRLVKNLKRRDSDPLTPLIDEYLLKRSGAARRLERYEIPLVERARPGGRLSPSSLCGCERQAALRFLGVRGRRRLDPDTQLIFDDGNWRHHRWQSMFLDMEQVLGIERFQVLSIEEQVRIPGVYISGSLDITVLIDGDTWVIDFKGINDYGFTRVTSMDEPIEEHVQQLTAYMRAKMCRRGMLIYDNKNNQQYRIYTVPFNRDVWNKVRSWCRRVLRDIENQRLPAKHPECHAGNFLYERCGYAQLCYGQKDTEEIRRLAYKDFDGIDAAWQAGLEAERA